MAKPKNEFADKVFAKLVESSVKRLGYEVLGPRIGAGFVVALKDSHYIAFVCSRAQDRDTDNRVEDTVLSYRSATPRLNGVVVIKSMIPTTGHRERWRSRFNTVVIEPREIADFLTFRSDGPKPDPEPKPARRPIKRASAARIEANAPAIIAITKSLAAQIDAKLEDLRNQRPNFPDRIEERDSAIAEYQKLRDQVAELERAVAALTQRNPNTKPVVEKGNLVGEALEKWIRASGPKHLEQAANIGLICTGAGLLCLIGVDPKTAAVIAGTAVVGKSIARKIKKFF